jgi:mRNA (guanine-N7-)-methyltransferase
MNADERRDAFDIVSAQFSLHYAFESEDKIRQLLMNISENLRPGRCFIGTIPYANRIVKRLMDLPSDQLSFGNPIYRITFDTREQPSVFGHTYTFRLEDAIDDCPEYLVHFPTLVKLAREYGLVLVFKMDLHEFYRLHVKHNPKYVELLHRMRAVNEQGSISVEEWEAISLYLAFAFGKVTDD